MPKLVPILLLAFTCAAASAQDRAAPQPAQDPVLVRAQKAAPQLLEFAGSPENFESLVLGLHRGAPVRLTAPADGQLRVTTFKAPAPLPLERVISVLEEARQTLAQLGIARPAPEQIAVALSGGVLELPTGSTELPGLLASRGPAGAAAAGPRTRIEPQWPPRKPSPEQQAFAALPAEIRALLGALPVREALQKVELARQQLLALGVPSPSTDQLREMVQRVMTPGSGYPVAGGSAGATPIPPLSPLVTPAAPAPPAGY